MRQEIKFGTGGWRAVIGEDFTRQNVRLVGAGLAQLAKKAHKDQMPIVIGYDRRFLSERAARWMAEVLAQAGIPVLFLHRSAPTPLIDFTVMSRHLFYGVEITASHNPAEYNGRLITANEILCLLYYYLVAYKGWKGPAVRNLATTHMLDRIAASFGEKCYEVPVGFKHISSKIDQVDAVLGGESSGGLTVRGHIHGKDSIYAASLFAEMLCVVGKSASQIMDELTEKFGSFVMVEDNLPFDPSYKTQIQHILFEEKAIPAFETSVERVSLEDGCKVYFQNGDFVICRFSGTEPLLRIFGESSTAQQARKYIEAFRQFLHI